MSQRDNPSGNLVACAAIAIAEVPTGTTGDIVVTFNNFASSGCAVSWWRVINLPSTTPTDTGNDIGADPDLSLDVPEGGFAVACSSSLNAGGTTWPAAATKRLEVDVSAGNEWVSAADVHPTTAGTLTLTADNADNSPAALVGASASWAL